VAKQVAELDRASGGRLALGVGIGGEYPMEFDAVSAGGRSEALAPTRPSLCCGGCGPVRK